jgi:hypothetical protein
MVSQHLLLNVQHLHVPAHIPNHGVQLVAVVAILLVKGSPVVLVHIMQT